MFPVAQAMSCLSSSEKFELELTVNQNVVSNGFEGVNLKANTLVLVVVTVVLVMVLPPVPG